MQPASNPTAAVPRTGRTLLRIIVFALITAAGAFLFWRFHDRINLSALAEREAGLRGWIEARPVLSLAIAFGVYVTVTGLSLPGAVPLSIACGWLFGFWRGVVLVSFASTSGATIAFLLSRFLFHDFIQRRFGDRLRSFNESLQREGALYLFALRLAPVVPFWLINLAMGLTPMRLWSFWWVTQIGMLPATMVFVWAGASVPSLKVLVERGPSAIASPQLLIALACLGVSPLVLRWLVSRWRAV